MSLFLLKFIRGWHCNPQLIVLLPIIILIFTVQCKKNGDQDNQEIIYSWPDSIPGRLIFYKNDGNNSSIFTLDANGLNQLTWGTNYFNPKWSPDDSKIVCCKAMGIYVAPEIYTLNSDGTGVRFLNVFGNFACWSSDGTKILYSSWEGPDYWVIDSSGKNDHFLGNFPGEEADWSPDGNKIIFGDDLSTGLQCGIYQFNLNDSSLNQLTVGRDGEPEFSPNGNKIVYVHHEDGKWYITNIFVMNADGTNKINLTNFNQEENVLYPTWSPDGIKIAFMKNQDISPEIFIINADGSGLIRITKSSRPNNFGSLDWSNTIK